MESGSLAKCEILGFKYICKNCNIHIYNGNNGIPYINSPGLCLAYHLTHLQGGNTDSRCDSVCMWYFISIVRLRVKKLD